MFSFETKFGLIMLKMIHVMIRFKTIKIFNSVSKSPQKPEKQEVFVLSAN